MKMKNFYNEETMTLLNEKGFKNLEELSKFLKKVTVAVARDNATYEFSSAIKKSHLNLGSMFGMDEDVKANLVEVNLSTNTAIVFEIDEKGAGIYDMIDGKRKPRKYEVYLSGLEQEATKVK